jgi:hypothetical protein
MVAEEGLTVRLKRGKKNPPPSKTEDGAPNLVKRLPPGHPSEEHSQE